MAMLNFLRKIVDKLLYRSRKKKMLRKTDKDPYIYR
jgi:hypothetical protein